MDSLVELFHLYTAGYFINMSLMAVTVWFFRLAMVPMILYNLTFSFSGFWDYMLGRDNPTAIYRSVLFFGCSALLGFQTVALTGAEDVGAGPWTLLFVMLFTLMNITAILGRKLNRFGEFDKFMWLFEGQNLTAAIRAARVNQVNPDLIDKHLAMAELKVLDKLIDMDE